MTFEEFTNIATKYGLIKKECGEYTLPYVHPNDFIMRYCDSNNKVNMATEIGYYEGLGKSSKSSNNYLFEFHGCRDMEDFRVELKLQYLIKSYKLMLTYLELEKIKQDF